MSERSAAEPGRSLALALRLRMIPHWHTYWRNPGDSGQPTALEWRLPPGWSAGPIQWPAPRRLPGPAALMSVVGHAPPPFFKRGPAPLARLVFFVTVCLVLLVTDGAGGYWGGIEKAVQGFKSIDQKPRG